MSIEDLMNVEVVSVSKSRQRMADAPAAVTVITQDDIRRSGLREIPEILRLSPGLFVQAGNQLTHWSVSSRGFADLFSNELLVLQDGRSLYTLFFSGVYWDMVDYVTADIERIEVIRGPGATLWGANAVNGVINITTRDSRDTQGLLVDTRVGTESSDLAVRYGGRIDDDTTFRVYAKGRAYDDLYAGSAGFLAENSQWQDSRAGFRLDHHPSNDHTFTLQGDVFYQSVSTNQTVGIYVPGYTHSYANGQNLLARWTHTVSDDSDYSLQLYYDRLGSKEATVDYSLQTIDAEFQHRFRLAENHEIIYGLGARVQVDEVGTQWLARPIVTPSSDTTYLLSGFIQDTITLVPGQLLATIGSKFELNSFSGFEYQPSGRLLWTPDDTQTVWAGVSRAVRTPNRWQSGTRYDMVAPMPNGPEIEVISRTMDPDSEVMMAYELGYRSQLNDNLSIDVTGFVNVYENLIALRQFPPNFTPLPTPRLTINSFYDNVQSAETYGAEFAANWRVNDAWRLNGSYSVMVMFARDMGAGVKPDDAVLEGSAPLQLIQLHSYWDITRTLAFNTSVYFVDSISGYNSTSLPGANVDGYLRLDLGLNWRPRPGLELSAGIQNLLDPQHPESSYSSSASAQVQRAGYVQLTWQY